ncbi:hypothetical protein [Ilumatobacter coccineus]|nr:hypothetical protein [Ilumatobacter coccineus]
MNVPEYVADMIRTPAPEGVGVLAGSTPVVSFGDASTARVATLGINPSWAEFANQKGVLLTGAERRLATLESVGAASSTEMNDEQVEEVVRDCYGYFQRRPFGWFSKLEDLIHPGLGASYYDGTACHLDLSPRATDPIWGGLTSAQKTALLDEGAEFLSRQLRSESIRTVYVNGASMWEQLRALGLTDFEDVGVGHFSDADRTYKLRIGEGDGVRYVGTSMNRQAARGFRSEDRQPLIDWLSQVARQR